MTVEEVLELREASHRAHLAWKATWGGGAPMAARKRANKAAEEAHNAFTVAWGELRTLAEKQAALR